MSIVIDEEKAEQGQYCRKHVSGCFCAVGWPYECQCPNCRDQWLNEVFRDSYCICLPQEELY